MKTKQIHFFVFSCFFSLGSFETWVSGLASAQEAEEYVDYLVQWNASVDIDAYRAEVEAHPMKQKLAGPIAEFEAMQAKLPDFVKEFFGASFGASVDEIFAHYRALVDDTSFFILYSSEGWESSIGIMGDNYAGAAFYNFFPFDGRRKGAFDLSKKSAYRISLDLHKSEARASAAFSANKKMDFDTWALNFGSSKDPVLSAKKQAIRLMLVQMSWIHSAIDIPLKYLLVDGKKPSLARSMDFPERFFYGVIGYLRYEPEGLRN